jgi:hypothetical protein
MRPPPVPIQWDDPGDDDVVGRTPWRVLSQIVAVGILLGIWALMGWLGFWVAFGILLVALYRKIDGELPERRERARLLADCEYQHDAWKRGDDATAFFGRFRPLPEHGRDGMSPEMTTLVDQVFG